MNFDIKEKMRNVRCVEEEMLIHALRNTHSHPTVVEAVEEENTTCVGVEIFVTS